MSTASWEDMPAPANWKARPLIRVNTAVTPLSTARSYLQAQASWCQQLLGCWSVAIDVVRRDCHIKTPCVAGLIMDDGGHAATTIRQGSAYLMIEPRHAQVENAGAPRLAAYLHLVSTHELAHLDGMGEGHDERFVLRREEYGLHTLHLIPEITARIAPILGDAHAAAKHAARSAHGRA